MFDTKIYLSKQPIPSIPQVFTSTFGLYHQNTACHNWALSEPFNSDMISDIPSVMRAWCEVIFSTVWRKYIIKIAGALNDSTSYMGWWKITIPACKALFLMCYSSHWNRSKLNEIRLLNSTRWHWRIVLEINFRIESQHFRSHRVIITHFKSILTATLEYK